MLSGVINQILILSAYEGGAEGLGLRRLRPRCFASECSLDRHKHQLISGNEPASLAPTLLRNTGFEMRTRPLYVSTLVWLLTTDDNLTLGIQYLISYTETFALILLRFKIWTV